MALIYKPNALYMSPKNESVDITKGLDFSFIFKGYQMYEAIGKLYQNNSIGEWTEIPDSSFHLDDYNPPYYNNETITKPIYGTNLINNKGITQVKSGLLFLFNQDKSCNITGVSESRNVYVDLDYANGVCQYPKGVSLTLSGGSKNVCMQVVADGSVLARSYTNPVTFTIPTTATTVYTRIIIPKIDIRIDETVYPQIVLGSENLPYMPRYDVYDILYSNVNSILGWGATIYGYPSTQVATSNNIMIPALKGFESGDMVATYSGSDTSTPYYFTYISSYDSKLVLGAANADGTDAEGTDITNTFTINSNVYINLTTGDEIKLNATSTSYYICKVNEGEPDPLAYYIRIYNSKANALAGGDTGIITASSLENNTYYVNPIIVNDNNIYYVGVIGGNKIKLYTSKEASLQGATEAEVTLNSGTTYTIQVFENSQVVQFTPILKNNIVFDLDDIYGTNRFITLVAGANNTYNYTSSIPLYNGQQITAVYNNQTEIFYIRVWNDESLSLYSNREAAINNNTVYLDVINPDWTLNDTVVYLSEILDSSKNFKISWQNINDIPMIAHWTAKLYSIRVDNNNNIVSKNLIEQTPIQYNSNVEYNFNHLLLSFMSNINIEGESQNNSLGRYMVEFELTDITGYNYEGSLIFDVGYFTESNSYSPNIDVNNCDSSVVVNWDNALTITGDVLTQQGTSSHISDIGIIEDYLYSGNNGGMVAQNQYLTFNTNITAGTFPTFLFQPQENFTGTIVKLDGDTQTVELRYVPLTSTTGTFILDITNKSLNTTVSTTVNTDVVGLDSFKVYLIGYVKDNVETGEYDLNGNPIYRVNEGVYIREYENLDWSYDVVTYNGVYSLNIPNSISSSLEIKLLKGNSSQDDTPTLSSPSIIHNVKGDNNFLICKKNLLKPTYKGGSLAGITLTSLGDGRYALSGASTDAYSAITTGIVTLPAGSYVVNGCPAGGSASTYRLRVYNVTDSTGVTYDTGSGHSFTLSHQCTVRTTFYAYQNVSIDNLILAPMIRMSGTSNDYEPYVGIDYPINLPVENLLSESMYQSGNSIYIGSPNSSFYKHLKAGTYTFTQNTTANVYSYYKEENDNTNTAILSWSTGLKTKTINLDEGNYQFWFWSDSGHGGVTMNDIIYYQLEKGSQANSYTPYGTTPIELSNIGTHIDDLHYGSKWFFRERILKEDMGDLSWSYVTSGTYPYFKGTLNDFADATDGDITVMSDAYEGVANMTATVFGQTQLLNKITLDSSGDGDEIMIQDSNYSSATSFAEAVSGMKVYYVTYQPIANDIEYEPLLEQLNNFLEAYTFNDYTYIVQTNCDNPFIIDVSTYVKTQ